MTVGSLGYNMGIKTIQFDDMNWNRNYHQNARIMFGLMSLSPLVQSAEKGAYPELMCATEPDLDEHGFYGPTGRMYFVGPVGECRLEPLPGTKRFPQDCGM